MRTSPSLSQLCGHLLACGYGAASPFSACDSRSRPETATQRRGHNVKGGRNRKGFTLVEILASLLFLAIAVPAIVGALGLASRTSEVAERGSLAGNLAENKLNEMLVDNAWQSAAQSNGDFGADFPFYRWQMSTRAWSGASTAGTTNTSAVTTGTSSLTELSVDVFYPVQGSEHSVRLTTLVTTSSATSGTTTTTGTSSSSTTR